MRKFSALLAACAQPAASTNPTLEPQIVEVTRMVQGTPLVETVVVTVPVAPEVTQGPKAGRSR